MKTARFTPVGLAALLCLLLAACGHKQTYRGIFCTLTSGGLIWTVQLRVPVSGSGPCTVVGDFRQTDVSGPPGRMNTAFTRFYSTGGNGKVEVSPDAGKLLMFQLKELGTLTTRQGESYNYCRLVTRQTDGLIVVHPEGLTKLLYSDLDAASRRTVDAAR